VRCYAEFADAARKAAGQNQGFRYRVRDLPEGEALDPETTSYFIEAISTITVELERLSGRIEIVGLPLSGQAEHIFMTCGEVANWIAAAPRIDAQTITGATFVYHEDVDDFIGMARAEVSQSD
jgi:hypothetical protein